MPLYTSSIVASQPCLAKTRKKFPKEDKKRPDFAGHGPVVQLVRTPALHAGESQSSPKSGVQVPPGPNNKQMGHVRSTLPRFWTQPLCSEDPANNQKKRKFPTKCQSQLEPEGKKELRSSSLLSSQIVRAKFGKVRDTVTIASSPMVSFQVPDAS